MGWVRSRDVSHWNRRGVFFTAGWDWWQWGIVREGWGWRVLLGWWQWCWHGKGKH